MFVRQNKHKIFFVFYFELILFTFASGLDTQLTLATVNISPQGLIASP